MQILGVIPARGGSKGLPRKNILPLAGKALIAHSIELATKCLSLRRTIVSTDDEEIADVARAYGGDVPWLRPAELATDTASSADVLRHALAECDTEDAREYDAVVLLQPTSPLRVVKDVEGAIALLDKDVPSVVSVCELEHPLAWTMLVDERNVLTPHPAAGQTDYNDGRQSHGKAWRLNGAVYVLRRSLVTAGLSAIADGTRALIMPAERSIDIDTAADMSVAAALLAARE